MLEDEDDDVVQPQEHLSLEEITSPLSAQILEFCESELFPETIQNSEVASNSNYCYEDNSSYTINMPFITQEQINNFTTATLPPTNHHLDTIFNSPEETETENDISASIDFTNSSFNQHDQFDFSILNGTNHHQIIPLVDDDQSVIPPLNPCQTLPSFCEDQECLSTIFDPSMNLNSFLPNTLTNPPLSTQSSGIFPANIFFGSELQPQELDYQGDNTRIFGQEPLSQVYNSCEIQAHSNESQSLVNVVGNSTNTALGSEITSLDDSTFKIRKLTVEEKREKIDRYMKKRNERNFSKKIKYACRKTLADSRPRVRGRFAKNDEFTDTSRTTCNTQEDDVDEDTRPIHVVVKEEEQMVDSSDIFAHISGVNSFKCSYPIQSWI